MYRSNPDQMLSFDYGTLPTKRQFMRAYERELEGRDYQMLLRGGADTEAADDTVFETAIEREEFYDEDEVWDGVKQLKRKWDAGDEEAGNLASSILYTLGIEWI